MRVFRFYIEHFQKKDVEALLEILRLYSNFLVPEIIDSDTKFIDVYFEEQTKITKEFIESKVSGLNVKVDELANRDWMTEYHNLHQKR